jgi:hypothetical protein
MEFLAIAILIGLLPAIHRPKERAFFWSVVDSRRIVIYRCAPACIDNVAFAWKPDALERDALLAGAGEASPWALFRTILGNNLKL